MQKLAVSVGSKEKNDIVEPMKEEGGGGKVLALLILYIEHRQRMPRDATATGQVYHLQFKPVFFFRPVPPPDG